MQADSKAAALTRLPTTDTRLVLGQMCGLVRMGGCVGEGGRKLDFEMEISEKRSGI